MHQYLYSLKMQSTPPSPIDLKEYPLNTRIRPNAHSVQKESMTYTQSGTLYTLYKKTMTQCVQNDE